MRSFVNALFEGIYDKKAEVNTTQEVQGHDHLKSDYSPYAGGAYLSRGVVYVGSRIGHSVGLFFGTVATAGVYVNADQGFSAGYSRSGNSLPMMKGYISPGWNTPGTGTPTSGPYLSARVLVEINPVSFPTTLSLRIDNATLGGRPSQVATFTPSTAALTPFWVTVEKIPCQGGENDFDLLVTADNNAQVFDIKAVCIFEEPENAPTVGGTEPIGKGR